MSIYVFSYCPFGFEGRIWDLIVSVPDHCLSFLLLKAKNTTSVTYFDREDVLYCPIRPGLVRCMISAGKERNNALMRKRMEKEERKNELKGQACVNKESSS